METEYETVVKAFINEEISKETFQTWFVQQPMLAQPDILRILKKFMEEEFNTNETTNEIILDYTNYIDAFEDQLLSLNLTKQMAQLEAEEANKILQQIEENFATRRTLLIDDILNKRSDATLLIQTAKNYIAAEKQINIYNPENWKEVLGML